jgi:putative ABC transport system ATP-binding protein
MMDLTIQQLLPVYFEENRKDSSEIWGKELLIKKGELIKIVAPSGSGKTSFIHFLYGLRNNYSGRIFFDKKNIAHSTAEEISNFRKHTISIIFQDMKLFPQQTVWENIEIKRQLDPFHPPEKIVEMAERLGIGRRLQYKCETCSFGEQQRVSIIRSLMQPFEFLLMDEPFSHLDENNAARAIELILEEVNARQASIIFVDLDRKDHFPFTRFFHL